MRCRFVVKVPMHATSFSRAPTQRVILVRTIEADVSTYLLVPPGEGWYDLGFSPNRDREDGDRNDLLLHYTKEERQNTV
jgi:hypothetical protein